jgi:hypothetical protein
LLLKLLVRPNRVASRDIDIAITDIDGGGPANARDHFVPGEQ